ncbi:MAG: UPF0158 family protein [Armatimonadota bacterium]
MENTQPQIDSSHPRLKIDAGDLQLAFESGNFESSFYVDLQTGKVVLSGDPSMCDEVEEINELIEEDPGRFTFIEPMSSREGFRLMEDFVETLTSARVQDHLIQALQQRHPFRNFKDALLDYPNLREEWFAFHDEAMRDYARQWLEEHDIDADLVDYLPE